MVKPEILYILFIIYYIISIIILGVGLVKNDQGLGQKMTKKYYVYYIYTIYYLYK